MMKDKTIDWIAACVGCTLALLFAATVIGGLRAFFGG